MKNLQELEKIIGTTFKNQKLIATALTHPSYLNEQTVDRPSYQRLEFLGDAVLELITSEHLYHELGDVGEGRLTEIRAALVRTETLARCAQKINLGEFFFLSKGEEENGGRENTNMLADGLEALIAALYLDGGIEAAVNFFNHFIVEELHSIIQTKQYIDPKSRFQEITQRVHKVTPSYQLVKDEIINNEQQFVMGVYVSDRLIATGVGKSKRLAEHNAAINALSKVGNV